MNRNERAVIEAITKHAPHGWISRKVLEGAICPKPDTEKETPEAYKERERIRRSMDNAIARLKARGVIVVEGDDTVGTHYALAETAKDFPLRRFLKSINVRGELAWGLRVPAKKVSEEDGDKRAEEIEASGRRILSQERRNIHRWKEYRRKKKEAR